MGSATARRLAEKGFRCVVAGLNRERGTALADEIAGAFVECDVTDPDAVHAALEAAAQEGRLVGVANFAGSILLKPAHLTSPEEFGEVLAVNLTSAFLVVRAAAPALRSAGGGAVLPISSAAARAGLPNHEAIAAAKGGVSALARSAAATYAPWGVRVNALAPGLVETPMSEQITGSEKGRERSLAMHALERLGRPADVAAAAAWLLDPDEASWVTGQTVSVDGGLAHLKG